MRKKCSNLTLIRFIGRNGLVQTEIHVLKMSNPSPQGKSGYNEDDVEFSIGNRREEAKDNE